MRISRPSTGTILGAIAVFIALGGTAAAAATVVNIADPTTPANIAHVSSSGRLETAGSDSVTNTVSTQLAAPSTYLHSEVEENAGCHAIAAPPSGKAMIVREVRVDVSQDPSPGVGQFVAIFADSNCAGLPVADVNPPTIGETTLPFDPGVGIPANSGLSTLISGSIEAELYTDGYSVASSQVPATRVTGSKAQQQRQ